MTNEYQFDKQVMKDWLIEKDTNYAIPDPSDNLIEIYEIDTVKDSLLIRAEQHLSPEHLDPTVVKKPLNVQNPNYTQMLDLIRGLQKCAEDLKKKQKELKTILAANKDDPKATKLKSDIDEIPKKAAKTFQSFMDFINTMISKTNTSGDKLPDIVFYQFKVLPDVRLLRYMLSKTKPVINIESVSLICSYLKQKYIV